jgi:multimeric flavodoxin WrbA
MSILALNGSPRKKKWNTVTLLDKVLEGAASVVAETESYVFPKKDFIFSKGH